MMPNARTAAAIACVVSAWSDSKQQQRADWAESNVACATPTAFPARHYGFHHASSVMHETSSREGFSLIAGKAANTHMVSFSHTDLHARFYRYVALARLCCCEVKLRLPCLHCLPQLLLRRLVLPLPMASVCLLGKPCTHLHLPDHLVPYWAYTSRFRLGAGTARTHTRLMYSENITVCQCSCPKLPSSTSSQDHPTLTCPSLPIHASCQPASLFHVSKGPSSRRIGWIKLEYGGWCISDMVLPNGLKQQHKGTARLLL